MCLGRLCVVLGRLATVHSCLVFCKVFCTLCRFITFYTRQKKGVRRDNILCVGKRWEVKTRHRTQRLSEINITSPKTFGIKIYLLPHFKSRLESKEGVNPRPPLYQIFLFTFLIQDGLKSNMGFKEQKSKKSLSSLQPTLKSTFLSHRNTPRQKSSVTMKSPWI